MHFVAVDVNRGSSILSAKIRKTSKSVRKILRASVIRFITTHSGSDSGSYDGDTMAGSSCKREQ